MMTKRFFDKKHYRLDEYGETRLMTYFNKPIRDYDEFYRVLIKKTPNTVIHNLDEVEDKTNEYLVHAEDVNDLVFDEKDYELLWGMQAFKGKDVL